VSEAIAASKSREISYGTPGTGSPMHVLGEVMNRASGAKLRHVPYRGVLPAVNDVLGGHIPLTWVSLGVVAPYFASGKLVPLAVGDRERSSLAPNVPTLRELGFGDVEITGWYGLFGPRGVPADVVRVLNTHLNEILKMPDVVARMVTLGSVPIGGAPQVLQARNAADYESFDRLIKTLGIRLD
jgi:tripartite-type tricarboxylate transporter receptor subunit TctC